LLVKSREGEVARRKDGNRNDVGMLRIACARGTLRASKACWNSMVLKIAKSNEENTLILMIKYYADKERFSDFSHETPKIENSLFLLKI
jgi:hypothetical protein